MNTGFRALLDNTIPWDLSKIKLLEEIISIFFKNPNHPSVWLQLFNGSNYIQAIEANQILVQLKQDPDLWQAADSILESAEDPNTKFFALQVLEQAIQVLHNSP